MTHSVRALETSPGDWWTSRAPQLQPSAAPDYPPAVLQVSFGYLRRYFRAARSHAGRTSCCEFHFSVLRSTAVFFCLTLSRSVTKRSEWQLGRNFCHSKSPEEFLVQRGAADTNQGTSAPLDRRTLRSVACRRFVSRDFVVEFSWQQKFCSAGLRVGWVQGLQTQSPLATSSKSATRLLTGGSHLMNKHESGFGFLHLKASGSFPNVKL